MVDSFDVALPVVHGTNVEDGTAIGDPTEVALVMLGDRIGVDEELYRRHHPRLGELAFDSDRKLMSTLHEIEGVPTLYTKGAIDVLLEDVYKRQHQLLLNCAHCSSVSGTPPPSRRTPRQICAVCSSVSIRQ